MEPDGLLQTQTPPIRLRVTETLQKTSAAPTATATAQFAAVICYDVGNGITLPAGFIYLRWAWAAVERHRQDQRRPRHHLDPAIEKGVVSLTVNRFITCLVYIVKAPDAVAFIRSMSYQPLSLGWYENVRQFAGVDCWRREASGNHHASPQAGLTWRSAFLLRAAQNK